MLCIKLYYFLYNITFLFYYYYYYYYCIFFFEKQFFIINFYIYLVLIKLKFVTNQLYGVFTFQLLDSHIYTCESQVVPYL